MSSGDLEVQERASSALQLISYIYKELENGDTHDICTQVAYLFNGELNPVAPKAQRKVQVPEGCVFIQLIINSSFYITLYNIFLFKIGFGSMD